MSKSESEIIDDAIAALDRGKSIADALEDLVTSIKGIALECKAAEDERIRGVGKRLALACLQAMMLVK